MHSFGAAHGPAERGRWAPHAQPLMGAAVIVSGLAGTVPPAHATAS